METQTQGKHGKRYTLEFKRRALDLIQKTDKPLSQVGRDLGVPACTLKWWLDREKETPVAKRVKRTQPQSRIEELEAENRRLQRENRELTMEREILKCAATWFAKESEAVSPSSRSTGRRGQ